MEDPRIISALFIFLKMAYYNVLINTFLFFCLQINRKEQSTRGVGSVAPHISITERNEV
jgi:hypothetical protein